VYNFKHPPHPPAGLIQTSGYGDTLTALHDPVTGWPLVYPNPPASLFLQDDLTYTDGKIVELENYIKHYGSTINQIIFYIWHEHLDKLYPELNLVYYPKFLWDHKEDAINHRVPDQFNFTKDKEFNFLCLNMNTRPHRTDTVKLLQGFPNRLISYKSMGWNLHTHAQDWDKDDYTNANINENGVLRNTANLIQLQRVYESCQFSVVTETRYKLPYDFVTEKTTQCWLALHPALYVSNKGHVQILRDWGFDVFDDVFDHSYDLLDNDVRLNTLVEDNNEVLTNGIPNYSSLQDRLLKNRDHYINNWLFP